MFGQAQSTIMDVERFIQSLYFIKFLQKTSIRLTTAFILICDMRQSSGFYLPSSQSLHAKARAKRTSDRQKELES